MSSTDNLGIEIEALLREDGAWWTSDEVRDYLRRAGTYVGALVVSETLRDLSARGRISKRPTSCGPDRRRRLHGVEYATTDFVSRVPGAA